MSENGNNVKCDSTDDALKSTDVATVENSMSCSLDVELANANAELVDSGDNATSTDPSNPPPPPKYYPYYLKVDPNQADKATEIKLCSVKRPHMRAFHFAWWSYHVSFLMWFSITPLLLEVKKTLEISSKQIWTSSITAVSGTIVMRFLLGPFCDKYGPRIPMGVFSLLVPYLQQ